MQRVPLVLRSLVATAAVAVAVTLALLPLPAVAQSASGQSVQPESAHGACGPGQPNIEQFEPQPIGEPPPGGGHRSDFTIAARTRQSDLVMVGRVASVSMAAGQYGIWTTATFNYPLILKSPPGGPTSGVPKVTVRFLGGTALFQGVCTRQFGNDLWPGTLYLVFASVLQGGKHRGRLRGEASPVDETSGLQTERSGPRIYWPAGTPNTLLAAVAAIKAEVAREKSTSKGPAQ